MQRATVALVLFAVVAGIAAVSYNPDSDLGESDCCPLVFQDLTSGHNIPAFAIKGGWRKHDGVKIYYANVTFRHKVSECADIFSDVDLMQNMKTCFIG